MWHSLIRVMLDEGKWVEQEAMLCQDSSGMDSLKTKRLQQSKCGQKNQRFIELKENKEKKMLKRKTFLKKKASRDITGLYRCFINSVHRNYAENLQTERI